MVQTTSSGSPKEADHHWSVGLGRCFSKEIKLHCVVKDKQDFAEQRWADNLTSEEGAPTFPRRPACPPTLGPKLSFPISHDPASVGTPGGVRPRDPGKLGAEGQES